MESLATELKKALAERLLGAELEVHPADAAEQAAGNHRNGKSGGIPSIGPARLASKTRSDGTT